jgi:hypothetical protein
VADHDLASGATVVAAGCGAFLVPELVPGGWRLAAYASEVARIASGAAEGTAGWIQVGAPAVAVAALYEQEQA